MNRMTMPAGTRDVRRVRMGDMYDKERDPPRRDRDPHPIGGEPIEASPNYRVETDYEEMLRLQRT